MAFFLGGPLILTYQDVGLDGEEIDWIRIEGGRGHESIDIYNLSNRILGSKEEATLPEGPDGVGDKDWLEIKRSGNQRIRIFTSCSGDFLEFFIDNEAKDIHHPVYIARH